MELGLIQEQIKYLELVMLPSVLLTSIQASKLISIEKKIIHIAISVHGIQQQLEVQALKLEAVYKFASDV